MKSRFDPFKHHRRTIRLKDYDYTSPGAYFVTIITHQRECLFDNNVFRRIAEYNWKAIARHFENAVLDEWIVMPNHIHGIIVITEEAQGVRTARKGEALSKVGFNKVRLALSQPDSDFEQDVDNASPLPAHGVSRGALGAIIGNFKSVTTRRINTIRKTRGATIWHRNYYEHIVRNEREQNCIREYIAANPSRWDNDIENTNAQIENDAWLADEMIWFSKSNLKSSNA